MCAQCTATPSRAPCSTPIDSLTADMVRTRGGYHFRPMVRFSTPEMEELGTSAAAGVHSPSLHIDTRPAVAPVVVPEEPQGFRRYQMRMGPRAPSPVPQRLRRKARPSKQARTLGPVEPSTSRPEPSPSPAEESSSPHLSSASRIRRPLFTGTPIPRNVDLRDRDIHGESFYDVPALTADPRFRNSTRLIT